MKYMRTRAGNNEPNNGIIILQDLYHFQVYNLNVSVCIVLFSFMIKTKYR